MIPEALQRRKPPKKRAGMAKGPREINGTAMDLRNATLMIGLAEKKTRAMVARGLIPHRRLGGRIIFIREELERWLASLPGCTLSEAHANLAARRGAL